MTKTPKALLKAYKLVNETSEVRIPKRDIRIQLNWGKYNIYYIEKNKKGFFVLNRELEITDKEFEEYENYLNNL